MTWRWDQGRLGYFNFDVLRKIASASLQYDLKSASHEILFEETGFQFLPRKQNYKPWRNYKRIFTTMLLVAEKDGRAVPTDIAKSLASPGAVTTDEFVHFIIRTHTDPSPSFAGWDAGLEKRWPLLFSIKYLLAARFRNRPEVQINEVIYAYDTSGFNGNEDHVAFEVLVNKSSPAKFPSLPSYRQSRESLKFIAQLSYLIMPNKTSLEVALNESDARDFFMRMYPIEIDDTNSPEDRILKTASLFSDAAHDDLEFIRLEQSVEKDSGFKEGTKVQKSHLVIERNGKLRREFFKRNPTSICDVCSLHTARSYNWVERILDIHHILPLSTGVEVSGNGTSFDDLKPVCPTCHRAVHSFYSKWLKSEKQKDFSSKEEAKFVYDTVKGNFSELVFSNSQGDI